MSIQDWLGPPLSGAHWDEQYCNRYKPNAPWVGAKRANCGYPTGHDGLHGWWNADTTLWEEWANEEDF